MLRFALRPLPIGANCEEPTSKTGRGVRGGEQYVAAGQGLVVHAKSGPVLRFDTGSDEVRSVAEGLNVLDTELDFVDGLNVVDLGIETAS